MGSTSTSTDSKSNTPSKGSDEPSTRTAPLRLRMPDRSAMEKADLHHELRHFHQTGKPIDIEQHVLCDTGLRPAVLTPWLRADLQWGEFPLYLPDPIHPEERIVPLTDLLTTTLDDIESAEPAREQLRDILWQAARAADEACANAAGPKPFREILEVAEVTFRNEIDVAFPHDAPVLHELWAKVMARLPEDGMLLSLSRYTSLELYARVIGDHRHAARQSFRRTLQSLVASLQDRLDLDLTHSPDAIRSDTLSAAMGNVAETYVDLQALSGQLHPPRGSKAMTPTHRKRVVESIDMLTHYLEEDDKDPSPILVHSQEFPEELPWPRDDMVHNPDSFATALALSEAAADELVPLLRAAWLARLEVMNQYDATLHDETLDSLDRDSLTAQDMLLCRGIVVLETDAAFEGATLASYSKLLHSRCPVHILVLHDTVQPNRADGSVSFDRCDPGLALRSVAHQEPYVFQSSLARPEHLASGLKQMAQTAGPAAAFISHNPWPDFRESAWLGLVASYQGRSAPCFRFTPGDHATQATYFSCSHNPQPRAVWPTYCIPYVQPDATEGQLELAFTFADGVAQDPACREHFCMIPAQAWDSSQKELSDYLHTPPTDSANDIPFIWIVDENGLLQRAAVTRALTRASRERMQAWQQMQALAGISSDTVRHIPEPPQSHTPQKETNKEVDASVIRDVGLHQADVGVTEGTIHRLVATLLGIHTTPENMKDSLPIASNSGEPTVERSSTSNAKPDTAIEEPYIDSVLCTSCDDCIHINSLVFAYNENKQAYIADPSKGTFAQLVKAAAQCPAACIHPGSPRAGDTSVTPTLLAKAAEFNA